MPPDLWRVASILSPSERKADTILTRSPSPTVHAPVNRPADGRSRSGRPVDRTLRARADAAIINQWLFEQTERASAPSTPPARPAA
jgi:hypothetical protein